MPAGCDKLQKPTDGIWREEVDRTNGSFHGDAPSGGALRSAAAKSDRGLDLAGESQGSTRPSQGGFWTVEVSLAGNTLSVSRPVLWDQSWPSSNGKRLPGQLNFGGGDGTPEGRPIRPNAEENAASW